MNEENLLQLLLDAANAKEVTVPSKPTTLKELGEAFQTTFKSQPGMADAKTSQNMRNFNDDPSLPMLDILVVVENKPVPRDTNDLTEKEIYPTIIFVRLADNSLHVDVMKQTAEDYFRIDVKDYFTQHCKNIPPYDPEHPTMFGYLVTNDRGIFTKLKLGDATANDFKITDLDFDGQCQQ
jgi:hypothetical protein